MTFTQYFGAGDVTKTFREGLDLKASGQDLSKEALGLEMSLLSRPDLSQLLRGRTCLAAGVCSGPDLTGSY